jgi:hypothetical protein
MPTRLIATASFLSLTICCHPGAAEKSFEEAVKGLDKKAGFFPLYWDAKKGRLLLEISRFDREFLYLDWLATGIGSNDIGLDRGQLGHTRLVSFKRIGPKVLLAQTNYGFRATSNNPAERQAVREAFASSVLGAFDIEAEDASGRVLVDATKFFLRDARDITAELKKQKQGKLTLDSARSAIYLPGTKNFPKNTEIEAVLTFTVEEPGPWLTSVAATPESVTVRQHHSLIELPDAGYRPRRFDPRAGYIYIQYMDFAVPIDQPLTQRFIIRHRLQKKDPKSEQSDPAKPLVYYVDRGAPEPIRSALVEGTRWWNQAFEAAGFTNAFKVELLPEDADPLDVRYNVIQWVHRLTRGWAYGNAVTDPRTGEIIKGHVTMDSQRARQVYRLMESLLASYEDGKPADPRIEQTVLARIRQLAGHEVGHTLGLAHNFAASYNDRASVMDYPFPLIELKDGGFDVSRAYATGIGDWDKTAIRYGYTEFASPIEQERGLKKILSDSQVRDVVFMTDQDARTETVSGAHPRAHLWDNGRNPVDELERILRVRQAALAHLSEKTIRVGEPLSTLEDRLVLVYLLHRYQVEAAVKLVGGLDYTYALRGDGQKIMESISAKEQGRALTALLTTIKPSTLAIPEHLQKLLPPPAYGYDPTRESFTSRTRPVFDLLAGPEAAAGLTIGLLLEPARASRLVQQHSRDASLPGLDHVILSLMNATWRAQPLKDYEAEVHRAVNDVVLYHLMALAADEHASGQSRALAFASLRELLQMLNGSLPMGEEYDAQRMLARAKLERFLKNPTKPTVARPVEPPPGQPIGGCDNY